MGAYVALIIGRPKTVDDIFFIKTITQPAMAGSSVDPYRRTEVKNTCKTLNDLTEKLQRT